MRLLCISLEFTAGTFSGNGIYCISQARAAGDRGVGSAAGPPGLQAAAPPPRPPAGRRGLSALPRSSTTAAALQVRALSRLGHQVLVLCGKPEGHAEAQRLEGAAGLLEVGGCRGVKGRRSVVRCRNFTACC